MCRRCACRARVEDGPVDRGEKQYPEGITRRGSALTKNRQSWRIVVWLRRQDSNLRQGGYKASLVSQGLGLSHHPLTFSQLLGNRQLGCRALQRLIDRGSHPLVSARFRLPHAPSADFAQDYHAVLVTPGLGFPEFTRFFDWSLLQKLHSGMKLSMAVRAK